MAMLNSSFFLRHISKNGRRPKLELDHATFLFFYTLYCLRFESRSSWVSCWEDSASCSLGEAGQISLCKHEILNKTAWVLFLKGLQGFKRENLRLHKLCINNGVGCSQIFDEAACIELLYVLAFWPAWIFQFSASSLSRVSSLHQDHSWSENSTQISSFFTLYGAN